MAIRRSLNVEYYKAQQAKPVFQAPKPLRFVTRRPMVDHLLWAGAFVLVMALGFILAAAVMVS